MPIISPDQARIRTADDRLAVFLGEQRTPPVQPYSPEDPGILSEFAAAARTQNVLGSFAANRLTRVMAGYSPLHGNQIDPTREWDPARFLSDAKFYQAHPYAIRGYEQLAAAQDEGEFDLTLQNLARANKDYETIYAGGGSAILASLAVNFTDPTNLIPYGVAYKMARGVGTVKLLSNVARGAAIGAAGNVVQEETLRLIDSAQPMDRLESNLVAAGFGAVFGGALSFLAAPNFRGRPQGLPSMGADTAATHIPTDRFIKIQERVKALFEQKDAEGNTPRNLVDDLADTETHLRQLLAEEPVEGTSIAALHRTDNADDGIQGDTNFRLMRELEQKYAHAGKPIEFVRHPRQDDYESLSALERSLNDAYLTITKFEAESVGAQAADPARIADGTIDAGIQTGTTAIAKVLQTFTPGKALDNAILDSTQLVRRTLFHDGTASKAAMESPDYNGPVPAEALKSNYEVIKDVAIQRIRDAYDPSRKIGRFMTRDETDGLRFTGIEKIAAQAARFKAESVRWTSADGTVREIKPVGHFTQFAQEAVLAYREQKAFADGFVAENLQKLPPEMEEAVSAIREFNEMFLDLADQVGLLPGERSLKRTRGDLDTATAELQAAEDAWRKSEGILTPDEMRDAIADIDSRLPNVPPDEAADLRTRRAEYEKQLQGPDPNTKIVYTSVPEELRGRVLFDWGSKGLRISGTESGPIPLKTGRARSFWDSGWNIDLGRVTIPNAQVVRKLKTVTDEVWPVLVRRGKFWKIDHYLAPKKAIEAAEKLVQQRARTVAEEKLRMAEAKHAAIEARVHEIEKFQVDAKNYFTRRFNTEQVRNDKTGFKTWLKRSWRSARNIGHDPETGDIVRLNDGDRPIIDDLRPQVRGVIDEVIEDAEVGDLQDLPTIRRKLKLDETIRSESDLMARDQADGTDLYADYLAAVDDYFERAAESTWRKVTSAENAHGIEHAFSTPSPLKSRNLVVNEADPAARDFLDADPERTLSAYFHTVGGRIATATAIERAEPILRKAGFTTRVNDGPGGSQRLVTPAELLKQDDARYDELNTVLSALDRNAGTSHAVAVRRNRQRVGTILTRRTDSLQGQGLTDPTAGANALWSWGGRQTLNVQYLALLGGQYLAAINDVASMTIFAELTAIPRNVKYLTKAMVPLKNATRRDMQLLRFAFETEHSRALSLGDIDFEAAATGVGHGMTRTITGKVGAGMQSLTTVFNEASLINPWNRYIKSAAAMIAMDRFVSHSRRLLRVNELLAQETGQAPDIKLAAALRQVGMSKFDYARLKERGINGEKASVMLGLIRKYGTDEDGRPLADLTDEEWAAHKGLALPNAGEWIRSEGDSVREIYDTYLSAINSEVEKAMIVTPGLLDKPLLNDHWWGRMVNQFQTFNMAWANQVARPLAQRPAGRQLATLTAYFATGAFVDAIRNHLAHRRDIDETVALWGKNPLGMTYAVVNTSGLSGWLNRPSAMFDKAGFGIGAQLNNTEIARSANQARSFWGSIAPTFDFVDRTQYGALGWASAGGMKPQHWHALRRSIPFQNLIWFRMSSRFMGIDPLATEQLMRNVRPDQEPTP